MNFYTGYIPDAPLEPPEEMPAAVCPNCHEALYAGNDAFFDLATGEILCCERCAKKREVEPNDDL
jgi:RNase P subunit RPR2